MKKIICFLFLLILPLTHSKLYQIFSLTRHGARYHQRDMWDGNDTKNYWAELTAVGQRQHENLGRIFRKQYIDGQQFLSKVVNRSQIEAFTTFANRTCQSLQSQFYGLMAPGNGQRLPFIDKKWHLPPYSNKTDLQEQNFALPLGLQTIPIKQSQKIILHSCPNFNKIAQQIFEKNSDIVEEMRVMYLPFMKTVASSFNFTLNTSNFLQMFYAYDDCIVNSHLGRPWPDGFTQEDFINLKHLANYQYAMMWSGNNTVMSCTGKIDRLLNLFDLRTKVPQNQGVKWTFVAGHEGDLIATQLALNITSFQCIEELYRKGQTSAYACENDGLAFASSLIFQLHSNNQKDFFVKVRSNGKYVNLIGRNLTEIPFIDFKIYMKKFVSNDLSTLCGRPIDDQFQNQINPQLNISPIKIFEE